MLNFRLLVSYHYFKNVDIAALVSDFQDLGGIEIFADSGAFSADTQGVTIDVHAYGDWIQRNIEYFYVYANLDDIGDAKKSEANQKILERRGLTPMPVFHQGSDFAVLRDLVTDYDYIGLGGLVPLMRHTQVMMPWLVKAFRIAEGRATFHGFGVTSWPLVRALPWRSIDSTSWTAPFRFGVLKLFDIQLGKFRSIRLSATASVYAHADIIRWYGLEPSVLLKPATQVRTELAAVSALSYMIAELWLNNRSDTLYPSIFLAPGTSGNTRLDQGTALDILSLAEAPGRGIAIYLADVAKARDLTEASKHIQDKL